MGSEILWPCLILREDFVEGKKQEGQLTFTDCFPRARLCHPHGHLILMTAL